MFVEGVFQADPHPGNLLLTQGLDGEWAPVLLDFGLTKYLPTKARRGASQLASPFLLKHDRFCQDRLRTAVRNLN
jgi:predicted unusual protein kinase regulating ubiquinone biosynthesis (AarF/ABC1/UbiB family)|eukprot:COSAG06_NODE_670_length_13210_cov_6.810464_2_plen_75_part_00